MSRLEERSLVYRSASLTSCGLGLLLVGSLDVEYRAFEDVHQSQKYLLLGVELVLSLLLEQLQGSHLLLQVCQSARNGANLRVQLRAGLGRLLNLLLAQLERLLLGLECFLVILNCFHPLCVQCFRVYCLLQLLDLLLNFFLFL